MKKLEPVEKFADTVNIVPHSERLNMKRITFVSCLVWLLTLSSSQFVTAQPLNEFHLQYGNLKQVGTGESTADTAIMTFQHASSWSLGDNFFFVDHLDFDSDRNGENASNPGFDNSEFYGEWYPNLSLGKLTDKSISLGIIQDVGILAGFNWAPEVDSWWFLPGVRLSLDLPGFAFANLDITAFQNHSSADRNTKEYKIFDEEDSWMVDFNWAYPFSIGNTNWSLEGHIEYIDGREQTHTFGVSQLQSWILAQPQLRFDLGKQLGYSANKLHIGVEYQYWRDKLGEKGTTDNDLQLLLVWVF